MGSQSLAGKVALVTGSTKGIGLGVAHHLAENGCSIILTGLAEAHEIDSLLEEFRRKYPSIRTDFVPGDLQYPKSTENLCKDVSQLYPDGVDILMNNAGIQHVAPIEDYPPEKWQEMMSIMLTAPFYLVRYFLPFMKKKGWGRIINTSSQMGLISQPGKVPYSTAKAGLLGFTKGVALEAAEFGITVNAICPAYVETDIAIKQIKALSDELKVSYDEAREQFFSARHPTKKPIEISQIADLVIFLCSPGAANITGASLPIDGGHLARVTKILIDYMKKMG